MDHPSKINNDVSTPPKACSTIWVAFIPGMKVVNPPNCPIKQNTEEIKASAQAPWRDVSTLV